ncbi:Meiotic nuclear division protein 1 [Rhizina undulata]
MPPKTLPPQAKLDLILSYFHSSSTAHCIKDLEKTLPAVAGISSMIVKDMLSALVAENLIRVEKIGLGNWYWSFQSDEKVRSSSILAVLQQENKRLSASLQGMRAEVEREMAERRSDDRGREVLEALKEQVKMLTQKRELLKTELMGYKENDPVEVERKRAEIRKMKAAVNSHIDNLYVLESYVRDVSFNDPATMDQCRKMFGMEEEMEYV